MASSAITTASAPTDTLTPHPKAVVSPPRQGQANKVIAGEVGESRSTVKHRLRTPCGNGAPPAGPGLFAGSNHPPRPVSTAMGQSTTRFTQASDLTLTKQHAPFFGSPVRERRIRWPVGRIDWQRAVYEMRRLVIAFGLATVVVGCAPVVRGDDPAADSARVRTAWARKSIHSRHHVRHCRDKTIRRLARQVSDDNSQALDDRAHRSDATFRKPVLACDLDGDKTVCATY